MRKTKAIAVAAFGAVAIAAAYVGVHRYLDYRRDCADRSAIECLREFSEIVGDGRDPVPAGKLNPLLLKMESLSGACSEVLDEQLFARRLDGAFLAGDYARAESMMDEMPDKSASWREGAKAKIRAHAALERGDKAAAICEFEAFCKALRNEKPDAVEFDPCSGVEWSCEGLLARNLKRMSDLAAEIGDKTRSEKYLSEARACAKVALQKSENDKDAHDVMLRELGALVK